MLFSFFCILASCFAQKGRVLFETLERHDYTFFLQAHNKAYRSVKQMGQGAAYYVGLHLKKAGYDDAALFYFRQGLSLYGEPFKGLCRQELYTTGSVSSRLEAVSVRLEELSAQSLQSAAKEKAVLEKQYNVLTVQSEAGADTVESSAYTVYNSVKITAATVDGFSRAVKRMPAVAQLVTSVRILVFNKQYVQAWDMLVPFLKDRLPLAEVAYAPVLSDFGKAGLYGASEKKQAADLFAVLANRAESENCSVCERAVLLFYTRFYAARLYTKAGKDSKEQAASLFLKAAKSLDSAKCGTHAVYDASADKNYDSAVWYYLDTIRAMGSERLLSALEHTAGDWKDPRWYSDITSELQSLLIAKKDWHGIKRLCNVLKTVGLYRQYAAAVYALIRSDSMPQREAAVLVSDVMHNTDMSLYYRALYAYYMPDIVSEVASAASNTASVVRSKMPRRISEGERFLVFSSQDAAMFIDGLIRFHLYDMIHNRFSAVFRLLPAQKALAVVRFLQEKKRYPDALRLASLMPATLHNRHLSGIRHKSGAANTVGDGYVTERMRLLYPRPWQSLIRTYAEKYNISEYFLYALIRSESFFDANAVSRAGAMGLAQVMPATAADIAKRFNLHDYNLHDPETSIRFGAYYFAHMLRRSGSIMAASCSYNAGINRVRKWQRAAKSMSPDIFIESIEYPETRDYSKKILTAALAYGTLYYGKTHNEIIAEFFHLAKHV